MTKKTMHLSLLPRTLPRGPHALSREQVRQSQRERLFIAMVASVAEKGYAATTVADIVVRSGVSRATFYELFRSVNDCFRATYEWAADRFAASLAQAVQPGVHTASSPLGRLDHLLSAYLSVLADQPAMAKVFLVEVYAAGPSVIAQRQRSLERFVDIAEWILREVEFTGIRGDKRFVIRVLSHALSSIVTQAVGMEKTEDLAAMREPIIHLLSGLLEPVA